MGAERLAGRGLDVGTGNGGGGANRSKGGGLAVEVGAGLALVVPGRGVVAVWIVGGVAWLPTLLSWRWMCRPVDQGWVGLGACFRSPSYIMGHWGQRNVLHVRFDVTNMCLASTHMDSACDTHVMQLDFTRPVHPYHAFNVVWMHVCVLLQLCKTINRGMCGL